MNLRSAGSHLLATILASLLVATTVASGAGSWETVSYNGNEYVTVRSLKEFYEFDTMTRRGGEVVLENKAVEMRLAVGGQDVWMNDIKFVFSYPIIFHDGRYLVSRIDLSKLVDPVLRPQYIRPSTPFTTVIIDPGHGGNDPGAVNSIGHEKDYTLKVGKLLRDDLKKRGFNVVLTRETDTYLTLTQRVEVANRYQNAVFISLHFNSGGRGRALGIETFTLSPVGVAHYGRGLKDSDYNAMTGNNQDSANIALATAVHSTVLQGTARPDRGIRRARFSVLTGVRHPAILLEGGFMSHPYEARLIANPTYQAKLSASIATAVVKYKMATEKMAGRR
jgi:N-acetylmuramoyl-L-alanine amidase